MTEKKMTVTVHEGENAHKEKPSILRVAAYCRVSTLAEEQELSFESQKEYFTKLIEGNEGMTLVGIFADHGRSGLNTKKHPQLQAMLQKARDGEIDMILVKSLSRLARNVIDLEEILKEMKKYGVTVVFEREGIRSDDPQCELIVKFLAAIAQEESNSTSQAVKWGHDRNNRLGRPTKNCPFGYRKIEGTHDWEIYEPEAEVVRIMFNLAKARLTVPEIAKELKQRTEDNTEVTHLAWTSQTVKFILTNESYIGDILTNKSITVDYLTKTRKKNEGEKEQYYLEDHHPAIVSRQLFAEVNSILPSLKGKGGRRKRVG